MGVGFMGLGAGIGIASLTSKDVNFLGFSLALLFGGLLLTYLAALERRRYYRRRFASTGTSLVGIGVLISAFPLPCVTPMIQQPIGAFATLLGALFLVLAGWLPEKELRVTN